ncbi:MAG TPA: STAS domain-containing protein [Nitrospiraceae bacterium]|jgi:anti-anti-sigma factor|nr:STAS domain-containing protein [Nitrospiraceae bacterium]
MNITEEISAHTTTLRLEGNFTYTQRKPFQDAIKSACARNQQHIVIDLSQVSFLDSAALGLLMVTHRQLLAEKRRLSICKPQSTVKQIIELANLHKTIPVVDSDVAPAMKKSA